MASNTSECDSEVLHRFSFFNVLKDGRINFIFPPIEKIPPADDPITGVMIKDVNISPDISARVFLPPSATANLPVLLYIHGGGYCMQSAFSPEYTRVVTHLVAAGNLIAVSVEYGLFPARPIPACYNDSWEAIKWIASHSGGAGPDPWLNRHADLRRLFVGGDSAGGNISHELAVRAGSTGLPNKVKLRGIILIHPHFGEDDKMWMYMCPSNEGPRDRRLMPAAADLVGIGCERVLVVVAERDFLRDAGKRYAAELGKSGWEGTVEVVDNHEKEHCFHILNPDDDVAVANQRRIISFIYHDHHQD